MPKRELRQKTGENIRVPVADLDVVLGISRAQVWRRDSGTALEAMPAAGRYRQGRWRSTGPCARAPDWPGRGDRRLGNAGSVEAHAIEDVGMTPQMIEDGNMLGHELRQF